MGGGRGRGGWRNAGPGGGGMGGRSDPFDCCVRVRGFHLISHMVEEKMNENLPPLA